jgi:hypothetical protein
MAVSTVKHRPNRLTFRERKRRLLESLLPIAAESRGVTVHCKQHNVFHGAIEGCPLCREVAHAEETVRIFRAKYFESPVVATIDHYTAAEDTYPIGSHLMRASETAEDAARTAGWDSDHEYLGPYPTAPTRRDGWWMLPVLYSLLGFIIIVAIYLAVMSPIPERQERQAEAARARADAMIKQAYEAQFQPYPFSSSADALPLTPALGTAKPAKETP